MAINAKAPMANMDGSGGQSVVDTSSQPSAGDLLIYDSNKGLYIPTGCNALNLSQFRNDLNTVSLSQVDQMIDEALINAQSGGSVDLSEYTTKTEVENMFDVYTPTIDLSAYALKTDIPTIPEVPTDVNQLTDINGLMAANVDLTGYATEAYVSDAIAEVNSGGTIDLTPYALKTDIPTDVTQLTDVNNLLDHPTDVSQLTDTTGLLNVDLIPYALKTELFSGDFNDLINTPTIFSGNYNDLSNQPIIPGDISQLTDNQGLLSTEGVDLTSYALKTYVDDAISAIDHSTYALKTDVFSGNYNDLIDTPAIFNGDYNSLINQPIIPADISQLTDNTGLLGQASVDLTAYALKTDLQTAIDSIDVPNVDLSDYVTHAALNTTLVNYQASVDLTPYALKSDLPTNIPTDVSDLTDTHNLIPNVDLTPYALKTELPTVPAIPEDISDLTDTHGLLQDADLTDYITNSDLQTVLSVYQPTIDLSTYALKTDIPTVPAIPADVSELTDTTGLLTHVDLTNYVTSTDLQTAIDDIVHPTFEIVNSSITSEKLNAHAVTTTKIAAQAVTADKIAPGVIPTVPTDISDLADAHGLLEHVDLTSYVTNADLTPYALTSDIPSLAAYATTEYVDTQIAAVSAGGEVDLTSYVTEAELNTELSHYETSASLLLREYITISDVTALNYIDAGELALELQNYVRTGDLPGENCNLVTDTELVTYNFASQDWVTTQLNNYQPTIDLTQYALKTEIPIIPAIPADVSDLTDTHGLLEHVDLTPYVTIASLPEFTDFVTETELNSRFDEHHTHTNQEFALKTELPADISDLTDTTGLLNGTGSGADSQTLSLMGNSLSISNGNTIDLSHLVTNSADNQLLSYDDQTYTLSIEDGNSIDLSSLVSGGVDLSAYATEQWVNVQIASALSDAETINFATVDYVDAKHAEANIYGGKIFHGSVTFEDFVAQKVSTITHAAQKREYVMAIQTTNELKTEVLLDNATRIGVAQGTTAMFKATFVASDNTDSASYVVRGIIDHNSAGINLVGSNVLETIADNGQGWTASVEVSPTSDSLSIHVIGSASTTVDWTVFCEISEVIR